MKHLDMTSIGAGLDGPPPQVSLRPGDVYKVVKPFMTKAGRLYGVGDTLELIEPTGQKPFGIRALDGINWVVKCRYFSPPADESVWSCVQLMINAGMLEKK